MSNFKLTVENTRHFAARSEDLIVNNVRTTASTLVEWLPWKKKRKQIETVEVPHKIPTSQQFIFSQGYIQDFLRKRGGGVTLGLQN